MYLRFLLIGLLMCLIVEQLYAQKFPEVSVSVDNVQILKDGGEATVTVKLSEKSVNKSPAVIRLKYETNGTGSMNYDFEIIPDIYYKEFGENETSFSFKIKGVYQQWGSSNVDLLISLYDLKNVTASGPMSLNINIANTIDDNVPPVFQNPQGNISKETDDGICGAVVTYPFPVATDNVAPSSEPIAGYSFLGEFNGHTYYYSNNSLDVASAIQAGDGIGGHLVSLESQAENDFIDSKVDGIWIGLTDVSNEGTFEWLTGEDVLYTNWNGGEPNDYGSGEDYTEMTANGSWNDLSGTNSRRYVIEFEGALVTQTGGLSSGSIFPVGTTVNTFLATDNAGNTATYSFNVTVVDVTPPKISRLKANYYDGINFDNFKEGLTVDELNYNWGSGAPESSLVGVDDFSIRFQGNVQAPQAGIYTFYTTSDDGIRLWVDGQLIVDNWTNHSATINSGAINLTANQMASLQLEFYERGGAAVVKLEWEGPGVSRKFVRDNGTGSCQDVTVDVGETGSYNLTVDEADPGYTDACGIDTRTLSKSIFTCDDTGSNPVTFTVTDVNGNTSECSFNVLVTGGPGVDQIVVGDSVCQGVDAQVFIQVSETGVIYSAYSDGVQIGSSVAGNGSDISITVPTSGFSIGDNQNIPKGCEWFL